MVPLIGVILILGIFSVYFLFREKRKRNFSKNPLNKRESDRKSYEAIVGEAFPNTDFDSEFYGHYAEEKAEEYLLNIYSSEIGKLGIAIVIGDSALIGAKLIDNLLSIDESFYEAVSNIVGKQLGNISDLHQSLDSWAQSWTGGLTDKAIDNLQGHLAESIVAEHLENLGHHVEFANIPNQVGYDLVVDGYLFNVKNLFDMSDVYKHFERYPNIGLILNHDINGAVAASIGIDEIGSLDSIDFDHLIILDGGLDYGAVVEQTRNSTDAVLGNVDFHIPWITVVLSSYRELKLLLKIHTNIIVSFKNILLDVAGTGIGTFLGSKGGALYGTFIAPGPGTVIGGIAGAIIGGLLGRAVTSDVKTRKARKALSKYKNSQERTLNFLKLLDREYNHLLETEQLNLKRMRDMSQEKIAKLRRSLTQNEKDTFAISEAELTTLFENNLNSLEIELEELSKESKRISPFSKLVWPSEHAYRLKSFARSIRKDIRRINSVRKKLFLPESDLTPVQKTNITFGILSEYGYEAEHIAQHLQRLRDTVEGNKAKLRNEIAAEKIRIAQERVRIFDRVKRGVEEIKSKAEIKIKHYVKDLRDSQNKLIKEMKKLGLKCPEYTSGLFDK